jgi:uncharacterized membrane protein YvbJ
MSGQTPQQMKICPFCGEEILAVAIKCKHCQSMLNGQEPTKVAVTGRDPFAEYHTPIQGKKSGNVTIIGWIGILLGLLISALPFLSSSKGAAVTEEDAFYYVMMGLGLSIGCFLWARR